MRAGDDRSHVVLRGVVEGWQDTVARDGATVAAPGDVLLVSLPLEVARLVVGGRLVVRVEGRQQGGHSSW